MNNKQRSELIDQWCQIVVDGMDTKTLMEIVYDNMTEYYEKCSDAELKEEIDNYDENLYNELVDNVESDPSPYDQIPTRY
jgi:hypothetical protein